jgi:hypothetical protein
MNGRVYDYNVGRFLSVDPVIVDPTNTQAINPYSYVMNNPLSYTDPSGYTCTQVTGTKFCGETIDKNGSGGDAEQAVETLQESQSQGNGAGNTGASSNNGNTSASGDMTEIEGQEDVAFSNAIQNLNASEFLNNQISSSVAANPSALPFEGGGFNGARLLLVH